MAKEFEAKVIHEFTRDVGRKIGEAAVLAQTAEDFQGKGLAERAFQSLLEIEPLMHDVSVLLNASSIMYRRDRASDLV